jgi:intracellular multiplication protein IcmJ
MAKHELRLAVKRHSWRPTGQYESTKDSWAKVRAQILDRDKHTCQFCGFYAAKYQEVHHLDSDHENDIPENLITTCPLCHATQHIGLAGKENRGVLIWLPEMTQQQLNHAILWLELGPYSKSDVASYISGPKQTLNDFFNYRIQFCAKKLGTSSPGELGDNLLNLSDEQYENDVLVRLSSVRLFPLIKNYSEDMQKTWQEQLNVIIPSSDKVTTYLQAGEIKKDE